MPIIVQILVLLAFSSFGLTLVRWFSKSRGLHLVSSIFCLLAAIGQAFAMPAYALLATILMIVLTPMTVMQFMIFDVGSKQNNETS